MAATSAGLVGRQAEEKLLERLLDRVREGEAQSVLITGEPGIGKTSLVQSITAHRADALILCGTCLPLVSVAAPFLALQDLLRGADAALVDPRMQESLRGSVQGADLLARIDDWLAELSRKEPVIFFIDDLQWADQGTLDVLTYLIAGPRSRRLLVIATIRWEAGGAARLVHRWLADIRRLPRLTEIQLAGLDHQATSAQLVQVMGQLPHLSLIDDVYAHTQGNPYLTRLIAEGLDPSARHIAGEIPRGLGAAVLASWSALTPCARSAATALAVGAAPRRPADLAVVLGLPEAEVHRTLSEAADAGLLSPQRDGAFWFRHPLSAEVLEGSLPQRERARLHDDFAQHLERRLAPGDVEVAAEIADHRARGADPENATRAALRAAATAEAAGAWSIALRMLQRSRSSGGAGCGDEDDLRLLRRVRAAAANASALAAELDAVEAMLECAEMRDQPTARTELLVDRMHLRFVVGRGFFELADAQRLLEVAALVPGTAAHALALAEYAHSALWHEEPGADAVARRALSEARQVADDRALAYALSTNAMVAVMASDAPRAESLAAEGFEAALRAHDWWAAMHATLWRANVDTWADESYAETLERHRERLISAGVSRAYLAKLDATQAGSFMASGRWRECGARLREVFALDPGPMGDVESRLTAARLAAWQGRQDEADQHLARAEELFEVTSQFLALPFDALRAEVRLGAGDFEGAYRAAMDGISAEGLRPTMCEWLLPLAARALADEAQVLRERGDGDETPCSELRRLACAYPDIIEDVGPASPLLLLQQEGLGALYAAEVARGLRAPDASELWLGAATALGAARLPWEQAYALWRTAEALLVGDADRRRGADALRSGLALAQQLEAEPIVSALLALARRARISVAAAAVLDDAVLGGIASITPRERQILALVVAGRTYGEIARVLTISEKTVSTHISHLLDKTGTANRVELAGVAERALAR